VSVPKTPFACVLLRTKVLRLPEPVGCGANPFGDCVQRHKQSKPAIRPGRECAKSSVCSGGDAFVAMVESANLRVFDDPAHRRRLDRSANWRVLAQRQVSPGSLIVLDVGFEDAPQTGFVQNDHMIQAFAPNGPDQALDVGILPGRLRSSEKFPDTQPVRRFTKLLSVSSVPIALSLPKTPSTLKSLHLQNHKR
jgi:hypothetical protein